MRPLKWTGYLFVCLLCAGLVFAPGVKAQKGQEQMHTDHGPVKGDADTMHTDHGAMADDAGTMDMTPGSEQNSHDHEKMIMAAQKEEPTLADQVKVEEQLGEYVALDAQFTDDSGKPIRLETIFDKPVVLLPVYFMCTSICNFLQADLANALNFVGQVPGQDFNVVTVSFAVY